MCIIFYYSYSPLYSFAGSFSPFCLPLSSSPPPVFYNKTVLQLQSQLQCFALYMCHDITGTDNGGESSILLSRYINGFIGGLFNVHYLNVPFPPKYFKILLSLNFTLSVNLSNLLKVKR